MVMYQYELSHNVMQINSTSLDVHSAILHFLCINIESLTSCHLLLNLLHELAHMILCEALPSII